MMKSDPELLAAVLAQPDEDAPRLVYADWLEEQGEGEYARFIRLQVEVAAKWPDFENKPKKDGGLWPGGFLKAYTEIRQLFQGDLGFRLRDELPDFRHTVEPPTWPGSGKALLYRRGFVERAALTVEHLLHRAGALFARQPVVRLRLTDSEPQPSSVPSMAGRWYWWQNIRYAWPEETRGFARSHLDDWLFAKLTGQRHDNGEANICYYGSAQEALDDLEQAALAVGAELAKVTA